MRIITLIAALLLAACGTTSPEKTADVWEPAGTVPKYRIRQETNGTVKV
jgi:uncharacterized lipoprotein YmbA